MNDAGIRITVPTTRNPYDRIKLGEQPPRSVKVERAKEGIVLLR